MRDSIQAMISKLFFKPDVFTDFDDVLQRLKDVSKDTVKIVKANGFALDDVKETLSDKPSLRKH